VSIRLSYKIFALIAFTIFAATVVVTSCRKSNSSRRHTTPLAFQTPPGFPPPSFDFSRLRLSEEAFALGKKLFHDNRLSSHFDATCGSCHQQQAAYTTFDHDLGHGTNHQHTRRNVPVIFNMAWNSSFEWDGRTNSLGEQVLACMTAPEKMGEQVSTVVGKLSSDTTYKRMFADAFGDDNISGDRLSDALTQFVVMIVSANSKYDRIKRGEGSFNSSEALGYELFKTKCASCHAEPLFTDLSYRNNGIGASAFHEDDGRMEVTGNASDSLKYKVPSLRNVMLTGYYAHDGRYISVGQLLDHYSSAIAASPTIDSSLADGISLSALEKFYITEFLFTLSDSVLIADPRFE
jgi:cytochrome c peroxidase